MEFQIGDAVSTPKGNGYINDIIDEEIIVDLIDGDHQREVFERTDVTLIPE
jgi:hypothetical protein